MKQIFVFISILFTCFPLFSQQASRYSCRLGFTFEISQQYAWGLNKPVIQSVHPSSPADEAGLKVNDIIEEINGINTTSKSINENNQIIQNASNEIKLKITNLSGTTEIFLKKDCKLANAINENQLTEAYSFYSLEDVSIRSFTCPFKTTVSQECDLTTYKTFGFSEIDPGNEALERVIYNQIKNCLEEKGLVYTEKNPDLIINTYYSYNKNLNYTKTTNADKFPTETRYNANTKKMESLPIYYHPLINSRQAEFLLNLGIRLIDTKRSSSGSLFVAWECDANELLQSNYSLENYAKFHIPLMFMQYPYPKTIEKAQFMYKKMKYNFTGINYNIDNLNEIADIDRMSPAYNAQLMPGDIVEKINGIKACENSKAASEAYKQFIYQTMSMRDPKTQYTNAEGFTKCMYWDPFKYNQINDEFKKPEHYTSFSYLFNFEPYINKMTGTNTITFNIKRDKSKMEFKVTPAIRMEESFETY